MKRNTILTSAVALALACAGAVAGQETDDQCAAKAAQLKTQIEASNLADSDRAKLEDSLSEAATADVARCDQIVSRVERELGASDETSSASADDDDYSSAESAKPSVNSGYEEGHAAASASMPDHPGAAANATDPASTTMTDKGYASPEATVANEDEPTTESDTASEYGSTASSAESDATSSATSDYDAATSSQTATGETSTSSTTTAAEKGAEASDSLVGMTADDLVNKRVKTADGKDVGEIDAVVTDKLSQAHGYAVVGVGGVLGVGETQVLLDLDQLQLTADGDIQVTANDESDLDAYPRYDEDNFEKYEGDIGRLL